MIYCKAFNTKPIIWKSKHFTGEEVNNATTLDLNET